MIKAIKYIILVGLALVGITGLNWTPEAWAAEPQAKHDDVVDAKEWQGGLLIRRLISVTAYQSGIPFDSVIDEVEAGSSLAQIAQAHGSSGKQIEQYVKDKAMLSLNEAVAVGVMTRAQKALVIQKLNARMVELVYDPNLGQHIDGAMMKRDPHLEVKDKWDGILIPRMVSATAYQSSVTYDVVVQAVVRGSSLAQVAEAYGSSGDEVVRFVADKTRSRLDEAVAVGQMSQADADELHGQLVKRITELVNDTDLIDDPSEVDPQQVRQEIRSRLQQY